jgi:hypothetical protein
MKLLVDENQRLHNENNILKVNANFDNQRKTDIIASQTKVQEKTIDALSYLQQHHQNTPKFELPHGFQLTDEEIEKYIKIGFPNAHNMILQKLFIEGRANDEIPLWCLDKSREKFVYKKDNWETEIGGKQLITTLSPISDQFNKYLISKYKEYLQLNKLEDFSHLQMRVLQAYDEKNKKEVIKESCNNFSIDKLFTL